MATFPLNIAVVIGKMNGAGVENSVLNHYRHMNHDVIHFDFITCKSSQRIPYENIQAEGGRVFTVSDYSNPIAYYKDLKTLFRNNNYDIVHAHTTALSPIALRAAMKCGVPVRIAHSRSSSGDKELFRNAVKRILKSRARKYATHCFACSALAGKWLFGSLEGVEIWHNASSLATFDYAEETRKRIRSSLGISESTFVLGNAGRLSAQKNQGFLLEIFAEFKKKHADSILLIAGEGELETSLKHISKSLGVDNSVMFLGHRNDMADLYQAMDVFCLPSIYEGLPNVVIEAQASGLPCVLSDCITREVGATNIVRFVSLTDSSSKWVSAIEGLTTIERRSRVHELAAAGFEVEDAAKRYERFYVNAVNSIE